MTFSVAAPPAVAVELFGVPRLLAAQRHVVVAGRTLGEVAGALAGACPALLGPVLDPGTGWLVDGYIFVAGERFSRDPGRVLGEGASVLLVSSVAGG